MINCGTKHQLEKVVNMPNAKKKNLVQYCITGVKSIDNIEWICSTCHLNIKEGKCTTSVFKGKWYEFP